MRYLRLSLVALAAGALLLSYVYASPESLCPRGCEAKGMSESAATQPSGEAPKAPDFSVVDSHGQTRHLSEFAGKFVVLEWVNHQCPFVRKHYESGNMQKLQETYTGKGVAWLTICSSAPGKQGNMSAEEWNKVTAEKNARPTAVLLDEDGTAGHAYGAKTTPHMFVINPAGELIYQGAIDDTPSTDQADAATAHNYVTAALDEAMAGQAVTTAFTKSYGCSVKY